MSSHIISTGLNSCYDHDGIEISCPGTGQDGELQPGYAWPRPRFTAIDDYLVLDRLTELIWPANANLFSFPMTWEESIEAVQELNNNKSFGMNDWRLPNRRELRSLISHGAKKPALPTDHPFQTVFLNWYWTSTTSAKATDYAWYVHMEGGRMFYGKKESYYLAWPVCGASSILPATGQHECYDQEGNEIPCHATNQDGDSQSGVTWPINRFSHVDEGILDSLTGLIWHADANPNGSASSWGEALCKVKDISRKSGLPWRMPTINELESLVDASCHTPALPMDHPFNNIQEAYWSSTTSFFEPDWSYVLYLHKGAVGVGYKKNHDFALWPVLYR